MLIRRGELLFEVALRGSKALRAVVQELHCGSLLKEGSRQELFIRKTHKAFLTFFHLDNAHTYTLIFSVHEGGVGCKTPAPCKQKESRTGPHGIGEPMNCIFMVWLC